MTQRLTRDLSYAPQACGIDSRDAPVAAKLGGGDKLATAGSGRGGRSGSSGDRRSHEECLRIGSANVGSIRKREGEVVDMLDRRRIDICCLQETRWLLTGD